MCFPRKLKDYTKEDSEHRLYPEVEMRELQLDTASIKLGYFDGLGKTIGKDTTVELTEC